jgi:MFS family permease
MPPDTARGDRATLIRQRSFAGLWWGQLFSITGDRLTYLALMGLLLEHSADHASYAALLAILGNVVIAPVLLFAPFTGAWIDRMNLKAVLVGADAARAVVVLSIPWVYAATGNVTLVFALVFALFALNVVFLPAKSAIIPEIVAPADLLAANSLLAAAGVGATVAGALVGGWVIDRFGWSLAMQLDAASYVLSVAGLLLIRGLHPRDTSNRGQLTVPAYARDVLAGWALLRSRTDVTTAMLALATVWWAGGMLHVAGNDHVQTAASEPGMLRVGLLLFAIGVGTGVGTWWLNRHGRTYPAARLLGGGLALAALAVALFAATRYFAVFVVAAVFVGLFAAPALILTETVLQQATDASHRARIFSAKDFLMRLTLLGSLSATAWLAATVGTRMSIALCALVLGIAGVVVLRRAGRT